jgi:hypothetical protein
MLAVTMILCKMRDGITLRRAIQDINAEQPDWYISDSARQEASRLIFTALQQSGKNPDVDLSTLNHQELFDIAQAALDIHLSRQSVVI